MSRPSLKRASTGSDAPTSSAPANALARRRYLAVDPDNRLVADTLEALRHGRRKDRGCGTSWSPEQISGRLRLDSPEDESMRISLRRFTSRYMYRAAGRCAES